MCIRDSNNSAANGVGLEVAGSRLATAASWLRSHRRHDATRLRCRQTVQTRRDSSRLSPTSREFNTHRRRDSTRQLSCVGVGGVYWAFETAAHYYDACVLMASSLVGWRRSCNLTKRSNRSGCRLTQSLVSTDGRHCVRWERQKKSSHVTCTRFLPKFVGLLFIKHY